MGNLLRLQKGDNTLTEGAPSSQQRDLIMALCGHHASIYYGEERWGRGSGREDGALHGTRRHDDVREEVIGWRRKGEVFVGEARSGGQAACAAMLGAAQWLHVLPRRRCRLASPGGHRSIRERASEMAA